MTHLVRMTRHPFSAASDRGTTSWTPILFVYEVFLLHLGTMDQSWVEIFAMSNRPQDATFVLTNTLPDGFPLQITIAIRRG